MKYIVLLGDGMPDWPISKLKGQTPLQKAKTPNMDFMATYGRLGLVRTIPKGFPPGSDVGHLSVLGYNPQKFYTGRAPIEAAAMGIAMGPRDIAFRCNLVTIGKKDGVRIMKDFSAGHISSKESHPLIKRLQKEFGGKFQGEKIEFFPGVGYRHIMIWRNGKTKTKLTPPHDVSDRPIEPHLPRGEAAGFIYDLIQKSQEILKDNGTKANSIWLWGQGKATRLTKFPIKGGLISAVDIVRGVGCLAGLEIIKVPGATGFFDTNYENKADYALKALKKNDFVFVHVESTDEAGHMGDLKKKLMALEDFDRRLIGRLIRGLNADKKLQPYRILLTSDHATPVTLKTHTPDPAVFSIYDCQNHPNPPLKKGGKGGFQRRGFNEKEAKRTGDFIKVGHHMIRQFLKKGTS